MAPIRNYYDGTMSWADFIANSVMLVITSSLVGFKFAMIAEEYWSKGIMTGAVIQLWDYVFSHTDIIRIFAEPFAHNIGSQRVLEKAGFQYEDTLRSNAVKNGKVLDMKMYARLK